MHGVAVQSEPVVAAVDAPKVERIVDNLLANARRHTPEERTSASAWRATTEAC